MGTACIERSFPPQGRFITVEGARLHVVELGRSALDDEPALLLVHGAGANLKDLQVSIGANLAKRHHVILVDRPGSGWSGRPTADCLPGCQARLIDQALTALKISRTVVVGHSYGGAVATALALADSRRIAGLVLLAPALYPWRIPVPWWLVENSPLVRAVAHTLGLPIGLTVMSGLARRVFAPQPLPPEYLDRTATPLVLRPSNYEALANDIAGLDRALAAQAAAYSRIAAPTVLIAGDRDALLPSRRQTESFAAAAPKAKVILLPGVGHMVHYAKPALVEAAVDDMLSSLAHEAGARTNAAPSSTEERRYH